MRVRATATVDSVEDFSGLKYLPESAREKALDRKANKFEKVKVQKCGSKMWTEVHELSALVREGKTKWEDLDLDDADIRLKWAGLFHRRKITPGKFMMRVKVRCWPFCLRRPTAIVTSPSGTRRHPRVSIPPSYQSTHGLPPRHLIRSHSLCSQAPLAPTCTAPVTS